MHRPYLVDCFILFLCKCIFTSTSANESSHFISSSEPVKVRIDGILNFGKKWSYQYKVILPGETQLISQTTKVIQQRPWKQENPSQKQEYVNPQFFQDANIYERRKDIQMQESSELENAPWMQGMQGMSLRQQRLQFTNLVSKKPLVQMPQPEVMQEYLNMQELLQVQERLQQQKLLQMQVQPPLQQLRVQDNPPIIQNPWEFQQQTQDRLPHSELALIQQRLEQIKNILRTNRPDIKHHLYVQDPLIVRNMLLNTEFEEQERLQKLLLQENMKLTASATAPDLNSFTTLKSLSPDWLTTQVTTTQAPQTPETTYNRIDFSTQRPERISTSKKSNNRHHHPLFRQTVGMMSKEIPRRKRKHKTRHTTKGHNRHDRNKKENSEQFDYESYEHHIRYKHQKSGSHKRFTRVRHRQYKKSREHRVWAIDLANERTGFIRGQTLPYSDLYSRSTNATTNLLRTDTAMSVNTAALAGETPKFDTEMISNWTFDEILGNPQQIQHNSQISTFTTHVLTSGLKIFDVLREKTNDDSLKEFLSVIADKYERKYRQFLDDLLKLRIKTRLGSQKVILNSIEESDRILKKLLNYVIADMDQRGSLSYNLDTAHNFQFEIDKETKLQLNHICKKFGICRTGKGFPEFLVEVLTIILRVNDAKFQNFIDALTEEVKDMDFKEVFQLRTCKLINILVRGLEMESVNDKRPRFVILKNIIANKNRPLTVTKSEAENSRLNATVALLELLDIFEERLPRTDANIIEWGDLRTSLSQWADDRRFDLQDIVATFMAHIRTSLNNMPLQLQERIDENLQEILS